MKRIKNTPDDEDKHHDIKRKNMYFIVLRNSFIVKTISDKVHQFLFWCEMVNTLNTYSGRDDINQFLLAMAKNYVKVLNNDAKNKCIQTLVALK